MAPSPQTPGLLSLLILILTATTPARTRASANSVQQPANHGLMTSTAPHGGICSDNDDDDDAAAAHNGTATTTGTTKGRPEGAGEEERPTARVPEGFFAAFGPRTAANPLCGRAVGVAWRGARPGRATAAVVGYCGGCWGPAVGGLDVSPGLFAAAGGRADAGGVVEVDWWLEG